MYLYLSTYPQNKVTFAKSLLYRRAIWSLTCTNFALTFFLIDLDNSYFYQRKRTLLCVYWYHNYINKPLISKFRESHVYMWRYFADLSVASWVIYTHITLFLGNVLVIIGFICKCNFVLCKSWSFHRVLCDIFYGLKQSINIIKRLLSKKH